MSRCYVDNAMNRRLGRVGMPLGSMVVSRGSSSYGSSFSGSTRTYVDNAMNRRLGRVGMPLGSMVVSKGSSASSPSSSFYGLSFSKSERTYVDNSMNRDIGREGMAVGYMPVSRSGVSDNECNSRLGIVEHGLVVATISSSYGSSQESQIKKLEEAKQLGALSEKLEKCQKKEVKLTEKKAQLEEKVQRLEGELMTLKTLEVTQQQKEKELNEKLKHHIKENQDLKVSLDQQTKAAENAESLKRTVKQLEKSLQEKICEASHYKGFVVYKELYEQRNQETAVIQQYFEQKNTMVLNQQMHMESKNETVSALKKQIKETSLSLKDNEARYQKQLQEMQKNFETLYEKSVINAAFYKKHAEELAKELADERSSRLEEIQRMHEEKSEFDTALYKKHAEELARDLADERSSHLEEIQKMHDELQGQFKLNLAQTSLGEEDSSRFK
ncbi:uncharacterized protein LOC111128331 isoform X2 [Crassostrea virginica]